MSDPTLLKAAQHAYGLLWRDAYPSQLSIEAGKALFAVLSHEERAAGIEATLLLHGPMRTGEMIAADIRAGIFPNSSIEAAALAQTSPTNAKAERDAKLAAEVVRAALAQTSKEPPP